MALETTVIGSFPSVGDTIEEKIQYAVEAQIRAGVKLISDGQTRYKSFTDYVLHAIDAFKPTQNGMGEMIKQIEFGPEHIKATEMKHDFGLLKKLCGNSAKPIFMMAGPATIVHVAMPQKGVYGKLIGQSIRNPDLYLDIAKAEVELIRQIDPDNSAAAYHIDEPFISVGVPFSAVKPALEYIAANIPTPVKNLHVCGKVVEIFPKLLDLKGIDVLSHGFTGDAEYANRALLEKDEYDCWTYGKKLGLGCINSASEIVDKKEDIADLIKIGIASQGSDPVLHPDCGLKTLSPKAAEDKLRVMCEVAEEF